MKIDIKNTFLIDIVRYCLHLEKNSNEEEPISWECHKVTLSKVISEEERWHQKKKLKKKLVSENSKWVTDGIMEWKKY